MNDQGKIDYLSEDRAFGILTRPALNLALADLEDGYLFILDLNDIHKLNKKFGYERVNNTIRETLKEIKMKNPNIVIGRVFSGDEIAIVAPFRFRRKVINDTKDSFRGSLIGFKYIQTELPSNIGLTRVNSFISHTSKLLHKSPSYAKI